jgi:hypothetical protein
MSVVGVCGSCGGPVELVTVPARRLRCACGASDVGPEFFVEAGFGDPNAAPRTPSDRLLWASVYGGRRDWPAPGGVWR